MERNKDNSITETVLNGNHQQSPNLPENYNSQTDNSTGNTLLTASGLDNSTEQELINLAVKKQEKEPGLPSILELSDAKLSNAVMVASSKTKLYLTEDMLADIDDQKQKNTICSDNSENGSALCLAAKLTFNVTVAALDTFRKVSAVIRNDSTEILEAQADQYNSLK